MVFECEAPLILCIPLLEHFGLCEVAFRTDTERLHTCVQVYHRVPSRRLRKEVGSENCIVLLLDEMKVKESLVYDKYNCQVVGFVEIDDIKHQMNILEKQTASDLPPIATHLLTIMVRGLFTSCKFPYAHFPTDCLTGDQIFPMVWEAIERLERKGFKVIAITADGASPNRKFFRMHCSDATVDLCYKTPNPYASEDRSVYTPFHFTLNNPYCGYGKKSSKGANFDLE